MQRGRTKARALRSYGQGKLARSTSADPQGVEVQPAAHRALVAAKLPVESQSGVLRARGRRIIRRWTAALRQCRGMGIAGINSGDR